MSEKLDDTSDLFPPLPKIDDPRWTKVHVYPKLDTTAEIRKLPRAAMSKTLIMVNRGAVIQVIGEARCGSWIAARVGESIGWIDEAFNRFETAVESADETPVIESNIPDSLKVHMKTEGAIFETGEHMSMVVLTQEEADYIFKHLKGIASIMKRAQIRSAESPHAPK